MNRHAKEWIISKVCDFMIDTKEIHMHKKFTIKAYSNTEQYKIPIRFQIGSSPIEHLVLDYQNRTRLNECEGINDMGEFIRLNCDLKKLDKKGYINYYLDNDLTNTLNEKLNSMNV
jgi:hypothetical protein